MSAWHHKGYLLEKLGRYDEALEAYNQEIALDSDSSPAWFGKGNVLDKLGRLMRRFSPTVMHLRMIRITARRGTTKAVCLRPNSGMKKLLRHMTRPSGVTRMTLTRGPGGGVMSSKRLAGMKRRWRHMPGGQSASTRMMPLRGMAKAMPSQNLDALKRPLRPTRG
ncbi:tetratricopeptide repeat protein [Methanogenium cariaci]|uniref:tetratricopeptide repeat protein n=1 Tax=Methanogenium cariaci TaxID=2197 RepID=UPI0024807E04|nr:tetratricopeptide repeat protein [Methanogenium cariaci]